MADVDRGVSTVVGYVLNVGIATLLIAGLLIAAGGIVADQRDRAVRSQFEVVGNRIAADMQTADTLLQASDGGKVTVKSEVPTHISGRQYQIEVRPDGSGTEIVLTTTRPSVEVTVPVNTTTSVTSNSMHGGTVVITGNGTGPLEVQNG